MSTRVRSRLGPGIGLSAAIAAVGYRRGSLAASGAAGAVIVGTATYLAGGWRWSSVLLGFFGSSSALSRLEERSRSGKAITEMAARGSRRDLAQALANGGVAATAALIACAFPRPALTAAFAGALAAANADTWATETGGLSRAAPRDLLSGKEVPAGTSGGVTPVGMLGAAGGAAVVAVLASAVQEQARPPEYGAMILLAGVVGSLVDSALGGSLQARYRCPRCGKPTERRIHTCGTPTEHTGGLRWMTNDAVNVCCTLAGSVLAGGLAALRGDQVL